MAESPPQLLGVREWGGDYRGGPDQDQPSLAAARDNLFGGNWESGHESAITASAGKTRQTSSTSAPIVSASQLGKASER